MAAATQPVSMLVGIYLGWVSLLWDRRHAGARHTRLHEEMLEIDANDIVF